MESTLYNNGRGSYHGNQRERLSKSITLQVAFPMVAIGLLALTSMLVTIMVTIYSEHDAEAINVAGSMRMQSYRIATLISAPDVEAEEISDKLLVEYQQLADKLYESSITQVVERADEHDLNTAYQRVKKHWESGIAPLLMDAIHQPENRYRVLRDYYQVVDGYVDQIDQLVLAIQKNAENKNELLGVFEGLSVFLFFMVMIYIIMRVDQRLVKPLKDLVSAARRISMGDFSYRTSYEGEDEIGLLSTVFNDMSVNLADYYRRLEDLVNEKTEHLQRSNQVLDCLYHTAQHLSKLPVEQRKLADIVTDLKKATGIETISLCLSNEANTEKYDLILPKDSGRACMINDCVNCHRRKPGEKSLLVGNDYTFPIQEQGSNFGFLYLRLAADQQLELWQRRLVEAVVENVASALALQYIEGQNRRLILFEERSIIARELHDSLAQSLSYMKMQVARLAKMFDRKVPEQDIKSGLDDLQTGLAAAYKHLRELLNTFRLQLDEPTLINALESTVTEFGKHHDNIRLQYELGHCPFTANEDIHILQIVREALSNAVKHAEADEIVLRCFRNDDGTVVFQVADNGVGLSSSPHKEHHYGLMTMGERAELLGGNVTLEPGSKGGTVVSLTFQSKLSGSDEQIIALPA